MGKCPFYPLLPAERRRDAPEFGMHSRGAAGAPRGHLQRTAPAPH